MKKLVKGIVEFREKSLQEYREKFSKLVYGQSPDVLFIACCDSRVVPNTFASTDPGDLFVVRNIGNLVPPYHEITCNEPTDISVSAAIEFSLNNLQVADIVICGHSECGAMMSFTHQPVPRSEQSCLHAWLQYAAPSYERYKQTHANKQTPLAPHNGLSQINVLQQLDHLKTYPVVKNRLDQGKLRLHGWWFDLATADVYQHEQDSDAFELIDKEHAERILEGL